MTATSRTPSPMVTLVLGGTRSGKSALAERMALQLEQPVVYIATALVDPSDPNHVARISAHKDRRPAHWETVECATTAHLVRALNEQTGPVLVDSLGTWLTQHHDFVADTAGLLLALQRRTAPTILVSEEVGLAVHAPTELGRLYVDAQGELNQAVASVAGRVLLVVAGRAIELPA